MDNKKLVGIWIRVSTDDQAKGESPEHHEKRARFYAESKDWQVKEVYHLEGVSGKSVMGHPETQRMLKDIKEGRITGLIFSKLARLARNTKELLEFSDIFKEYNADLISLQEAIDTSSPAGRLFYTMISAMAQWEREEIASRVAASVPVRARLGTPLGGPPPLGYQWVNRRIAVHPEEAPVRRLIHELFLEHRRLKTVAKILNQKGYRTRKGAPFTDTALSRILHDPIGKGQYRRNYSSRDMVTKKHSIKPPKEWIYINVEPTVPEELWNQTYAILAERQQDPSKRPAKRPVHLFAHLIFCSCGRRMGVPHDSPKYWCRCDLKIKIAIEDVEKIFQEQLKGFFFSPEEITRYLEGADQTIKEKEELLATLEKEKPKLRTEMDNLYPLYYDKKITADEFGERFKPLETRYRQLDNQIPELQGEIDFLKIKLQSGDQIFKEAQDLYSRWDKLSPEQKRKVVEDVVEKITIGPEEINIQLKYLPSVQNSPHNGNESGYRPA